MKRNLVVRQKTIAPGVLVLAAACVGCQSQAVPPSSPPPPLPAAMKYNIATDPAPVETASTISPEFKIRIPPTILDVPPRWCGEPRPNDPLLAEAIRLGSRAHEYDAAKRALNIPDVAPDAVDFVRDEAICQHAAWAYQIREAGVAEESGGRLSLSPVLVIRLGEVFVVEAARPRGPLWEVAFFDPQWTNLGWGYGAGQ